MNPIVAQTLELRLSPEDALDPLGRALADVADVLCLAGATATLGDGAPPAARETREPLAAGPLAEILLDWASEIYDLLADGDLDGELRRLVVPIAERSDVRGAYVTIVATRTAMLLLVRRLLASDAAAA